VSFITFTGCKKDPSDKEVTELVNKLWSSEKPKEFLMPDGDVSTYMDLGFNHSPGDTAYINNVEIIERKDAETSNTDEKEVRMLIRVSGSINTWEAGPLDGYQSKLIYKKIFVDKENFNVKHEYYFKKDKWGDWNVKINRKVIK
jgi:hypothetical protein